MAAQAATINDPYIRVSHPAARAKDRWHQLADAIKASDLPASDKSVFRLLLDTADYVTAELPAKFTPTRKTIARQTSHSIRQVHYSVDHLQRHGWLAVKRGHKAEYVLSAGVGCDCSGRVHHPAEGATASRESATTAPILVQPLGATPQVRTGAALRGSEREEERKRELEPKREPLPVGVANRGLRSLGPWPPGSIGEWENRE